MIEVTKEMVEGAKTRNKGYTSKQINVLIPYLGNKKRWKKRIVGKCVKTEDWERFVYLGKIAPTRAERRKGKKFSDKTRKEFFASIQWKSLRVRVLEHYACKCMMCGRSPKTHGIVVHVDHIKPRSLYPELELEFDNLQILCEDCNIGKSNKYETDWRP